MKILVTGAAGFIGYHTAKALLDRGEQVVGLDNLNDYYDVSLKQARLAQIDTRNAFSFVKADLADKEAIAGLFRKEGFNRVVHLAAQAGVRYSLDHPHAYVDSNVVGFLNILEGCRHAAIEHLVFASSSSVYGLNRDMPYRVMNSADHPISLYGATKRANELMAHTYAHLYGIPSTGLRFFTVYGPWGRPDMALFTFTRKILAGEPIDVFNNGEHARDFTYIDDIVEGVVRTLDHIAGPDPGFDPALPSPDVSSAPFRLFNIGNNSPVKLMNFIGHIEKALGKEAKKNFLPMQPGDVLETYANVDEFMHVTGYEPKTDIAEGIARFVAWYRGYYGV